MTDVCFFGALRSGLETEREILEKEHHLHTKHTYYVIFSNPPLC